MRKELQCIDCIFYDEVEDMFARMYEMEKETSLHYCTAFPNGINHEIWTGKKKCPHYIFMDKSELSKSLYDEK